MLHTAHEFNELYLYMYFYWLCTTPIRDQLMKGRHIRFFFKIVYYNYTKSTILTSKYDFQGSSKKICYFWNSGYAICDYFYSMRLPYQQTDYIQI